jgi:predicted naringenin-chalcone synthase
MRTELIGFGTALPVGSLTQDEAVGAAVRLSGLDPLAEGARKAQILNALYRRSGVGKRHSVVLRAGDEDPFERQTFYKTATDDSDLGPTTFERMQRFEMAAPELAQASCERALEDASVVASEIRHLVTVSCSGFAAPGYDLALYPALGLAANVSRTNVGFMGCHGALNGLRVARALSLAHPGEAVLVCATELCSLHHQYTDDPQQIVANSLFADGSAAVVVRSSEATHPAGWTLLGSSSCVLSESTDMMSWRVGDNGFQMTLSAQVPEVIRKQLKPWLESWLATQQLTLQDIASWAVHPGGPRILTATASALGLGADELAVSTCVLADCGNMSSPTILFILDRMRRQEMRGPCVALAFGPGLVVEVALLER